MADLVTVIIPCYRGEAHVGRMVEAVCKQSYPDVEILVVGNGPEQDAQRRIVEDLAKTDGRVRYLSLSRAGVSSARNFGLDHARGEWVAYVDDDDLVPEDWLSRFAVHFDKRPDVIAGGIRCLAFGSRDAIGTDVRVPPEGLYSQDPRVFLPVFSSDVAVRYSPCSKVIRRDFLVEHAIRFDETLTVCEDCVFSQEIALKAASMCFIPQTGYLYVARQGSAAGRYHESMERALSVRRSLLCQVAARGGANESELESFRRDQTVADSLDVFLNAFRKGTPHGFRDRVSLLGRLFADEAFVSACRGYAPSFSNKPLFAYWWIFRLGIKRMGVLLFALMFAARELRRRRL